MELSREEIRDIGIATAQHVLEGLHRYTKEYVPPSSIQQGLRDSMIEERTAGDWYHRRSKMAAQLGDKTTADLYIHIAGEEEQHWKEFGTRLTNISQKGIAYSKSTSPKDTVKDKHECKIAFVKIGQELGNLTTSYVNSLGLHSEGQPVPPTIPFDDSSDDLFESIAEAEITCNISLPKTKKQAIGLVKAFDKNQEVTPAQIDVITALLREDLGIPEEGIDIKLYLL